MTSYNTRHLLNNLVSQVLSRADIERMLGTYDGMLLADNRFSANTRKAYVAGLRRYLVWLARRGIDRRQLMNVAAQPGLVAEFVSGVETGEVRGGDGGPLSPATLRLTVVAINEYHRRMGVDRVPPRRCMTIATPRRVPRALLGADLARWDAAVEALDYARESPSASVPRVSRGAAGSTARQAHRDTAEFAAMRADRDRAILAVMRYAGLRPGEVASLDTNNVELGSARWLRVSSEPRQRQIRLTAPLAKALTAYLAKRWLWPRSQKRALFLTVRGERFGARSVGLLVADVAEAAGLADVSPQTLRDTFATELTQLQAIPLREAAHVLGVRDVATLRKYRRLMHEHGRRVADGIARIAAALAERPDPGAEAEPLRIAELAEEWRTIADCARDHWTLPADGVLAVEQFLTDLKVSGDELVFDNRYAGWAASQYQQAIAAKQALTQARVEIDRQWGNESPGRTARRRALQPRVQ